NASGPSCFLRGLVPEGEHVHFGTAREDSKRLASTRTATKPRKPRKARGLYFVYFVISPRFSVISTAPRPSSSHHDREPSDREPIALWDAGGVPNGQGPRHTRAHPNGDTRRPRRSPDLVQRCALRTPASGGRRSHKAVRWP